LKFFLAVFGDPVLDIHSAHLKDFLSRLIALV